MATSLKTQVENVNALGRENLNAKGITTDGTETTYQLMSKISEITGGGSQPQVKEYMEYDTAGTEFVRFSYYSAGTKTNIATKVNDGKAVVAGVYDNNMLTIYCIALDPQTEECAKLSGNGVTTFSYKGHAHNIGSCYVYRDTTSPASRESYAWTNKCETFELSDIGATGLSDWETIGTYILDYYYSVEVDTRLKDFIEGTLTEIVDDTITTVREGAFYHSTLQEIDLPNCETVGKYGFTGAKMTSLNLPNCISIGNDGVSSCSSLTSLNLPNCTSVGDSGFSGSSSLTSLVLPNCESIGESCFAGCSKLKTLELPKVKTIKVRCFYNCKALDTLIIRTEDQVATVGASSGYTFSYTPISSGTGYIYVPDDLVEDYKVATNWKNYADQIKGLSELPA